MLLSIFIVENLENSCYSRGRITLIKYGKEKRHTHKKTIKALLVTNVPKKSCVFSRFSILIVLLCRKTAGYVFTTYL